MDSSDHGSRESDHKHTRLLCLGATSPRLGTAQPRLGAARICLGVALLSLGVLVLLWTPASATEPENTDTGITASASWGQVMSSQLARVAPVSFWTIQMSAPVYEPVGLRMRVRFDAPVIGDPSQPTSLLIQPGRTDYSLAFELMPPGLPIGAEYHHVSGHEVSPLTQGANNEFEEPIRVGGASNLVSLQLHGAGARLRMGYGGLWTDTNTAPILLGLNGILLNTRVAQGPFFTTSYSRFHLMGVHGRAALMLMFDTTAQYRFSGDYVAWGVELQRPLGARFVLGASYLGNNGFVDEVGINSMVSAFMKLRWGD